MNQRGDLEQRVAIAGFERGFLRGREELSVGEETCFDRPAHPQWPFLETVGDGIVRSVDPAWGYRMADDVLLIEKVEDGDRTQRFMMPEEWPSGFVGSVENFVDECLMIPAVGDGTDDPWIGSRGDDSPWGEADFERADRRGEKTSIRFALGEIDDDRAFVGSTDGANHVSQSGRVEIGIHSPNSVMPSPQTSVVFIAGDLPFLPAAANEAIGDDDRRGDGIGMDGDGFGVAHPFDQRGRARMNGSRQPELDAGEAVTVIGLPENGHELG